MKLNDLIEEAGKNAGSLGKLAARLNKRQPRISEWKSGIRRPDTNELAELAEIARLPILKTIAEIEADINPKFTNLWKKAVSELRQNQG